MCDIQPVLSPVPVTLRLDWASDILIFPMSLAPVLDGCLGILRGPLSMLSW